MTKGTITSWSCNTASNGFQITNSYILTPGNQQLTELIWSGNTPQWAHTNVWGAGMLLATYSADPDPTQNVAGILNFYIDDPLGTRRVMTDYAGNTAETCHSLPFGNGEDCAATPAEHLFTQHERDAETGNDYLGARYYASSMGRFLTPDWSAKAEPVPYSKLDDPQTLNLYAYVGNNPFIRLDADGHKSGCAKGSGGSSPVCNAGAKVKKSGAAQQTNNGPFLAKNPGKYMGKTCGSGQCVDFVKADTDVPRTTKDWAPGAKVGTKTPEGAAIATFGASGKYENKVGQSHAAELVSVSPNGKSAVIRDQWKGQEVHTRTIYDRGGKGLPVNDLSRYSVIVRKEDQ